MQTRIITTALVGACAATTLLATAAQADVTGPRIGVLKNGELIVKEGGTNAGWGATQMPGVAKFEIDGNRIGVLTTSGQVWVKEGGLQAGWGDKQADGVKDFHLAGNRIGILRNDTTLAVKEGPTNAPWTEQTNQVTDFDLTPDRIGVVYTNGIASVKAGNLNEGWANQLGNAKDIELGGNRIGIRRVDNSLVVKEGTIYDPNWVEETPDVVDFDLTPTRIGVVLSNGLATVKEGGLSVGWHDQRGDAKDIELSGNRIGVLTSTGLFTVKEGGLNAFWDDQTHGVTQGDLSHPGGGGHVSIQDLRTIWGTIPDEGTVVTGLEGLNAEMDRGGITNPARKAAFLATLRAESGFRYNALEGGQTAPYKGRGYIQLTGQGNYQAASTYFGHNFVTDPEAAASLRFSAAIARWYWTVQRADSNNAADHYDMGLISRYVGYAGPNGDTAGEDLRRCNSFKSALRYFNGGALPVPESQITCYRH